MVVARLTADCKKAHFWPKTDAFSAENGCVFGRKRKNPNTTKYIFVQKRNWPKTVKILIFSAENEIRSVFNGRWSYAMLASFWNLTDYNFDSSFAIFFWIFWILHEVSFGHFHHVRSIILIRFYDQSEQLIGILYIITRLKGSIRSRHITFSYLIYWLFLLNVDSVSTVIRILTSITGCQS